LDHGWPRESKPAASKSMANKQAMAAPPKHNAHKETSVELSFACILAVARDLSLLLLHVLAKKLFN